jgi:ubiquinone biosynthesis protein
MRIFQTGRQLGQAVKNVQRLRQITTVFAKHGFEDVLYRMNLGNFLPKGFKAKPFKKREKNKSPAQRLREAFEELGPSFVKLGQLLSTRPDIVPEAFLQEFIKLQDTVRPLSFEEIQKVIKTELGQKTEEFFEEIEPKPLASASIAQVHAATLKTGEKVVIKVQRPGIDKIIENDVSILAFSAKMMERYVAESRIFGPTIIVDEFFRTLSFELDFVVEANNMNRMAENLSEFAEIVIPKVYKKLSTQKILTLERFEGIKVNDQEGMIKSGVDRKHLTRVSAKAFFKSILMDGLFHGDLHGGNLFVLPGNRLGIIDFGMVGRLSQRSRDQLANMVISLINEDYETLCYQYAELATDVVSIDFEGFQREVRNTLSPFMGLSLSEVNAGRVLIEATKIATEYGIKVPGDWMLVFKAILTVEGMGRSLDPDFNFLEMGDELVKDFVKHQYSPQRISKELAFVAKDLSQLMQVLPRQIRWMFRKFNSNDFAIEIKSPELEALGRKVETGSKRNSTALIAGSLIIAGSLSLQFDGNHLILGYPAISVILFGAGGFFLVRSIFR